MPKSILLGMIKPETKRSAAGGMGTGGVETQPFGHP